MSLEIVIVKNQTELTIISQIREKVFIRKKDHCNKKRIIDDFDEHAILFLIYNEKVPIGSGRLLLFNNNLTLIEKVCILPQFRGKGICKILLTKMETFAKENGYIGLILNSKLTAVKSFQKFGFEYVKLNENPRFENVNNNHKKLFLTKSIQDKQITSEVEETIAILLKNDIKLKINLIKKSDYQFEKDTINNKFKDTVLTVKNRRKSI